MWCCKSNARLEGLARSGIGQKRDTVQSEAHGHGTKHAFELKGQKMKTPGPWCVSNGGVKNARHVFVDGHRGKSVASCHGKDGEAEANATFIAHAANCHDGLVRALQDVVRDINDYERVNNLAPSPGRTECWDSVARAKAELAVATGQRGNAK